MTLTDPRYIRPGLKMPAGSNCAFRRCVNRSQCGAQRREHSARSVSAAEQRGESAARVVRASRICSAGCCERSQRSAPPHSISCVAVEPERRGG